jgi:hypothetical protein
MSNTACILLATTATAAMSRMLRDFNPAAFTELPLRLVTEPTPREQHTLRA